MFVVEVGAEDDDPSVVPFAECAATIGGALQVEGPQRLNRCWCSADTERRQARADKLTAIQEMSSRHTATIGLWRPNMISAATMRQRLELRPFVPFRIVTSAGSFVD